jgi:GxxExxY protein
MPIEVQSEIRGLNQEEFHELNHRVLGVIFGIHNDFGRFLDEVLFKREIAARCEAAGILPAKREVRIRVSHESFRKDYSLDLLFCSALPLEAKTADVLVNAHRAQALNYVLLLGLQHGTLVNLKPERVQHEFVSTRITPERRHQFTVVDKSWQGSDAESGWLKEKMIELLRDWGAFLEVSLYREAIAYLLGGPPAVIKPVAVYSGKNLLGFQKMHLLSSETAFEITAVTGDLTRLAKHQSRLLQHTALKRLQWINLNHHQIEFSTLGKAPI